ncbi:MAG: hypothetical protein M1837_002586 [Sclerophora amabilis]|nr:MAG: hypothetical protein M1837_002586 [Sclerophora amabilis]
MHFNLVVTLAAFLPSVYGAGYRTVGSSGCAAQMVFVPPYTSTVVFIDNYHDNYGGPGFNVGTGQHSATRYVDDDNPNIAVFGTEYNLETNELRKLQPLSNTFCSAGSFFPDGTLLNIAGAEGFPGVDEGFDRLRTYDPGPCTDGCSTDWVELESRLQVLRWYPTSQTLVDGSVLVVGGSQIGGLVLNEADVNVPTYEIVYQDARVAPTPVTLPILEFTEEQNLDPGKSYNLYPHLHLLPNPSASNLIFTIAGNQTVVWDYGADMLVKKLPDTPLAPRTFPSGGMSVMLPLRAPDYAPKILLCGGSSGDIPDPVALDDCYTINPLDEAPEWTPDDDLPNGAQTMSDGIVLPDGTILIINGARTGASGGRMADDPVFEPLIYNATRPAGDRFSTLPGTAIPRMYHAVSILLPSGEVLIAGSNPLVGYSREGKVDPNVWPLFQNNGHECALHNQQRIESGFPTEYRVEIFSPAYISAPSRPIISASPESISYDTDFEIEATIAGRPLGNDNDSDNGDDDDVQIMLCHTGFHTHGLAMGQRMVQMTAIRDPDSATLTVTAPRDASVMPPGVYLIFAVDKEIPSEGVWVELK